jgi:two-component system, NarL family, sensor kinase
MSMPASSRRRDDDAAVRRRRQRTAATDMERLLGMMREANERLVVSAVRAQDQSDDAQAEATNARVEVERLMTRLRKVNRRLTTALARARALAEEARHREESYRQLSVRLLTLQDEERRRLAIDLHDSTAQRLAALIMHLDALDAAASARGKAASPALVESRALAEQCVREVRTFAYVLHPPLLDEAGLVPAMRWYVAGFSARSGIQVDLEMGAIGRLPGAVETALFRIVQECLANVHRHAGSETASIQLARGTDEVTLQVHDTGRGLRNDLTSAAGVSPPLALGVGIPGMRGRIAQLGGTFDIKSTPSGTTVRVRLPLTDDAS